MKNLFTALLISALFYGCQSKPVNKSEPVAFKEPLSQSKEVIQPEPFLIKHRIVAKQDISYENTPRLVYRIILDVDSIPADADVLYTSKYLWENGNKGLKEFTVFSYLPTMKTDVFAYGVGEFNQNGLVRFNTNKDALYGTKWEIKKPVVEDIPLEGAIEYSIDISAIHETGRIVKVKITTNFPDGTILYLSIGRIYYKKNIKETYLGDIYNSDIIIDNGSFETATLIDDSNWYNKQVNLNLKLPNDIPPISKVTDKIEIYVLYTPAKQQPEEVIKILGATGEFVTGKGAEKFDNITVYRSEMEMSIPFKK